MARNDGVSELEARMRAAGLDPEDVANATRTAAADFLATDDDIRVTVPVIALQLMFVQGMLEGAEKALEKTAS